MQDMDNGMGMENMENTIAESWQNDGALLEPENPENENFAEEGGMQDESQEKGTEKAKRRRKKQEEEHPQDVPYDEQPDSFEQDGAFGEIMGGEESYMDEPDGLSPEDNDEVSIVALRRRERGLDSQGRVIYDQGDRGQHDLSVLTGARNSRRILTATIDGIEPGVDTLPRVVFHVGTVKVLIPFTEMGMDLNPKEIDPGEAVTQTQQSFGREIPTPDMSPDFPKQLTLSVWREFRWMYAAQSYPIM